MELGWAGLGWGQSLTLALSRLGLVSSHGLSVGCSAAGAVPGCGRLLEHFWETDQIILQLFVL